MRAHSENALKVATFLSEHPKVETVFIRDSNSIPDMNCHFSDAALWRNAFVSGERGTGDGFCRSWEGEIFTRATSLGGVESLIEHRASIEGQETKTPDNLLRMSVGLEHVDDLIDDLAEALD
jgi:cystathionine gamma-synthase